MVKLSTSIQVLFRRLELYCYLPPSFSWAIINWGSCEVDDADVDDDFDDDVDDADDDVDDDNDDKKSGGYSYGGFSYILCS